MSKFNSFACQNPIVLPLKYPIHEYNMWYIGKKKDLQEIGYDWLQLGCTAGAWLKFPPLAILEACWAADVS